MQAENNSISEKNQTGEIITLLGPLTYAKSRFCEYYGVELVLSKSKFECNSSVTLHSKWKEKQKLRKVSKSHTNLVYTAA